ncbi:MAG TPA: hypothetical protein VHO29_19255 [Marmoricola sp.]|nr:hypothetical protein [Marmoricola sp.]
MELIDVTPTPLQRRTGAVWVPWDDLAAQQRGRGEPVRVLAPGDDVMLRFEDGSVRRGWVLRNAKAGEERASVIVFAKALDRRIPLSPQRRPQPRPQRQPEPQVQDVPVRTIPPQRDRRQIDLFL